MKKINGRKYPKPMIRTKQPLCCTVNPYYVCKMCRSRLCAECADITDKAIRLYGVEANLVKTAMRMADHLDLKCCQKSLNNEIDSTWVTL